MQVSSAWWATISRQGGYTHVRRRVGVRISGMSWTLPIRAQAAFFVFFDGGSCRFTSVAGAGEAGELKQLPAACFLRPPPGRKIKAPEPERFKRNFLKRLPCLSRKDSIARTSCICKGFGLAFP